MKVANQKVFFHKIIEISQCFLWIKRGKKTKPIPKETNQILIAKFFKSEIFLRMRKATNGHKIPIKKIIPRMGAIPSLDIEFSVGQSFSLAVDLT
jgi:hypothetical protein